MIIFPSQQMYKLCSELKSYLFPITWYYDSQEDDDIKDEEQKKEDKLLLKVSSLLWPN